MELSSRDSRWRCLVDRALAAGDLQRARALLFHWLDRYAEELGPGCSRALVRHPDLWQALADVVERTSDQYLLERFWQLLDQLHPPLPLPQSSSALALPLLGIPILNRVDLLQRLLDSLDHPVETLAVVDNSGGDGELRTWLRDLQRRGHPLIQRVCLAHSFGNAGVACSWNQILLAFPAAPLALLANNDIAFAPGVIAAALERIDPTQPQFLALLPEPAAFSAFLITAKAWDRIGLFDPAFHPAYCEDLEYRDRLRADPGLRCCDGAFAHEAMLALNSTASATIASDPALERCNRISFALNRLWYLSHRRLRHDPRGSWVRRWLAEWQP